MMLLFFLAGTVLVNTFFYLIFAKISYATISEKKFSGDFPVSVIVCAKNEAHNLKKNIPLLLQQDYPNFEIILINDASLDDTMDVIEALAATDPRIHTVNVENNEAFWSNKKYSLTLGIKRAKHERLLFTDADCQPASKQWLRLMTQQLSDEKQLVLGYGAYQKTKGWLNKLIRFETLMTAIQYFSYAKAGMPYMGVGRNLAYTRQLFYENRGFMSHMQIASGDDDLFVNEAATKSTVALCLQRDAFTLSQPKETFKDWFYQKRRHVTTSKYYKTKHQTYLGLYFLGNFFFWVAAILSLVFVDWKIPLALITFRLILQYLFLGKAAKRFQEKDLAPFFPVLEVFLVCLQLTIFSSNLISKPRRWK